MSAGSSSYRTDTPSALAPGTRLGEFELLDLLGVGGFGIVYLAFDHALEREVAIKEYMPATLAGRTETMHVTLRSHSDAESFALGLKSFVNEAKLLARFDHPSLLKVHRFWEANGTAYMAMPVLRGRNLKAIRSEMSGPPDEAWLRQILLPLLGAIEKLHGEDVFHRDIAPDNIQIEPDGRPVLLDFGAARRVLSDKSQALTAILKPAYAPIEQYGEAGSVKQGPWTDLYALGATLHYMLLGRPPAPATARTVHDEGSSLNTVDLPGCSEDFLHTIDWMLCPRPTDRPQSVAEVRQVLEGKARPPARRPTESAPVHWERTSVQNPPPEDGRIDLDVGDGATQFLPPASSASGVTEHVWLEPEKAAAVTGMQPPAPDTTWLVRPNQAAVSPAADFSADSVLPPPVVTAAQTGRQRSKAPLLVGLGAIAAVAAAVLLWPRQDAPPAAPAAAPAPAAAAASAQAPPPAASAVTVSAPAVAGTAAPAASAGDVAAPAATESAIQTVVVPAPDAGRRAEPAPRPAAAAADKPTSGRGNAGTAGKPAESSRAKPEAPQRAPAPLPAAVAPPLPTGPGPSCGPREGVRYLVCMERECASAEFSSHPACQRWKP